MSCVQQLQVPKLTDIRRAEEEKNPVDEHQSLKQVLSVLQLHELTQRTTGPQAIVFTWSVFY